MSLQSASATDSEALSETSFVTWSGRFEPWLDGQPEPYRVFDNWTAFDNAQRQLEMPVSYQLRWHQYIEADQAPQLDMPFWISMLAAYEVRWDGHLIGANGRIGGSKQTETPGTIEYSTLVPNHWLTPGWHTVSLRASSHYRPLGETVIRHGYLSHFNERNFYISLTSLIPAMFASMGLLVGLYFLALFATQQRAWPLLAFGLFAVNFSVFGLLTEWPHMFGYHYQ